MHWHFKNALDFKGLKMREIYVWVLCTGLFFPAMYGCVTFTYCNSIHYCYFNESQVPAPDEVFSVHKKLKLMASKFTNDINQQLEEAVQYCMGNNVREYKALQTAFSH